MARFSLWILMTIAANVVSCKRLWSSQPASYGPSGSSAYILKTGYPVGNGKLGAIPFGPPSAEKVNINVDSLWSGGPFSVNNYTGGNPAFPKYQFLPKIRAKIFSNATGEMDELLGSDYSKTYGSNRVLGNMTIALEGVEQYSNYQRSLDLGAGVHTTTFTAGSGSSRVTTELFCSYLDQICVYHLQSENTLPVVVVGIENLLVDQSLLNTTCSNGVLQHTGKTQAISPEGMKYAAIITVGSEPASSTCQGNDRLRVRPKKNSLTIIWSAETNYDMAKGNSASGYSFKGSDPSPIVSKRVSKVASKDYHVLLKDHMKDFQSLQSAFTLDLPDPHRSAAIETATLIQNYKLNGTGDPYLESLLFDYSRYLLIASSRENSLPANLQGRWTELLDSAWSADYHANINLQMNYWVADQTGLADTQKSLWNYMEQTWVPRGTETARLLYNATKGWVVHNEMNTFGFTAMKDGVGWANYPIASAWMMQHVADAFQYTQDREWFTKQGYPLIRGVAEFWLSQLQDDAYTKDGSLVVNPCNSAETGPTTFGCVHYQQLLHQLFDMALAGAKVAHDSDSQFLGSVTASLNLLDKGLHVASWGGLREWKMPEELGYDGPSTHRHLSHLVGWFPGYSISSFASGYRNKTIQDAVRQTLISRGMGNAEDANAGWAKVWRSACWARLNDTTRAYDHLRYAIEQNFAGNGLSMYSARNPPFQIDANFGFGGAVLSMLVVDLPLPHDGQKGQRTVVLGPAIPTQWGEGSVKGLRLRGGGIIDFSWNQKGIVIKLVVVSRTKGGERAQIVNVEGSYLGIV